MQGRQHPRSSLPGRSRTDATAFTLIELMMVVAILGITLGVALPALVGTVRKAPLRQALNDLDEGFLKARMLAILSGRPAELVIRASDGTLLVRQVSESVPAEFEEITAPEAAAPPPLEEAPAAAPPREELPRFAARLHESLAFRQLIVNLRDMLDEPEAAVRFQPNGTCDALTAILTAETGQERLLQLEITTGRLRIQELQ